MVQLYSIFHLSYKVENYTKNNVFGKEISKGRFHIEEVIDVKNYPNGLYFLKLENRIVLRFKKKHEIIWVSESTS